MFNEVASMSWAADIKRSRVYSVVPIRRSRMKSRLLFSAITFLLLNSGALPGQALHPTLQYDGVYMSPPLGSGKDLHWQYFRFYGDGTALSVISGGQPSNLEAWFHRENRKIVRGAFRFDADRQCFSVVFPHVRYDGEVDSDLIRMESLGSAVGSFRHRAFVFIPWGEREVSPKAARAVAIDTCRVAIDSASILNDLNLPPLIELLKKPDVRISRDKAAIPSFILHDLICLRQIFSLANPDEPYESGCLRTGGYPTRQLELIAQSSKVFAMVFISGGMAQSENILILRLDGPHVIDLWSGNIHDAMNLKGPLTLDQLIAYLEQNVGKPGRLNWDIVVID